MAETQDVNARAAGKTVRLAGEPAGKSEQFVVTLKGKIAAKERLPKGASWAIVSGGGATIRQLIEAEKSNRPLVVTIVDDGHVIRRSSVGGLWSNDEISAVDPDAFAPNARARAILRGRDYADADLKEAGGAYDVDQVRRLLHGVSRQAIDKRVQEGSLLTVPGPSNRRRFPTVQFNEDGSVVPGLRETRAALPYDNPWSVLNFLIGRQNEFGGKRPIDLLRKGRLDLVVAAAKRIGVQGA